MFKYIVLLLFVGVINGDLLHKERPKGATLKPISECCDIPELGNATHLTECSNPKPAGPCNDVQCVFEKSGFLTDSETLNNDVYRNYLLQWADNHPGWKDAVERAIRDCVDKDIRQYLDDPCKSYDVFTCTSIAMLKKCPKTSWKC